MKTVGTFLTMVLLLLPWCSSSLLSQENAPEGEKKIVITKRTIDPDGTETLETIIKKGRAAENFDVEQYIEENRADNVELDVRVQDSNDEQHAVVIKRRANRNPEWVREIEEGVQKAVGAMSGGDKRAFLGVELDSDEDSDEPGLVVEVIRGSAAEKAGLRHNDVILKLNGQATNDWDDLSDIIADASPGDVLAIEYSRNGQITSTTATLTTRAAANTASKDQPGRGFLGVSERDDDDDDAPGVPVSVVKDGAAEKAGLQNGDVLLRLNDTEISDWEDLSDFMHYTKAGESVRVTFQRNGQQKTADVTLGEPRKANLNFNWQPEDIKVDVKVREKDACLGVYTSASGAGNQEGARVSDFTKTSAAREAEMQNGDVITAVNNVRVKNHDELWNEIAKYQPGDKVQVAFYRDGQPRQIEASLKACRDNSNRIILLNRDDSGGGDVQREFLLWEFDQDDKVRLRERRVITIHRAEDDADAPKLNTAPEQAAAVDRTLALENFQAYPNPTQGQVTISFRSEPTPIVVSLLDMGGRQLFREELNAFSGDYFQQFDLSEYAKGTIIVHVVQGNKVFTEQILVN